MDKWLYKGGIMSRLTDEELNDLSKQMYGIMYINDKPNYNLTAEEFMQLLFIMDELSSDPLLRERSK